MRYWQRARREADLLAVGAYRPAEPQDDRAMLLDLGDTYIECRIA